MKTRLIEEFLKSTKPNDIYVFEAAFSPLLTLVPWSDDDVNTNGQNPFTILMINKGSKSFAVVSESAYKEPAIKSFQNYIDGKVSADSLRAPYELVYEVINKTYEEFFQANNLSNLSDEEIASNLDLITKKFSELIARTLFIETMDKEMCLTVLKDENFVEKIWEKGTHPAFESFDSRRKKDLHKIKSEIIDKEKAARYAQYVFIDYYRAKSLDFVKNELEKEIGTVEVLDTSEFDSWTKTLNFEEKKVVDYLQFVMEARDLRKDPIAKAQVLMYEYATELAKRAGIADDFISNICAIDYVRGVSWLKENLETIKERSNGQILLLRPDFTLEVDIEDYDEAIKAYMELTGSETAVSEIKGQCASVGKVTGPVQVVLEVNSDTDFKEGSVLVTSMTRPEFVPFMKKAIAVVTNEGGITCHAAIVSRELKIPCVIGTKLATKILKTGDMVEVDADKGIVKIL